jgi:hypothetical protein
MQPPKCTRHINQQLHRMAKSRWALSTVVTTLIILVISVLLASVVTYFAINVTSTRVQEESLALAKQHVWYDSSNQKAQAAIMIINAGGRDIVIDRLTVRGQECAWSKVLFFVTGDSISGDLFYNTTLIDGGSISVGGSSRVFKQATSDLTLQSGKTLIIYMSNPDSISVNDIGLTVSINIFTSQAMYYKETNVQGTSGTQTASSGTVYDLQILYASAYYNTYDPEEIGVIVSNTGSSAITLTNSDLIVKGEDASATLAAYVGISDPSDSLPYLGAMGQIQGHSLTDYDPVTIPAGEKAIVYYLSVAEILADDVDQSIFVGLSFGDSQIFTIEVTVVKYM